VGRVIGALPDVIQEHLSSFAEHRMGIHRLAVAIDDGTEFDDVYVAREREVIRVATATDIPVDPRRVVTVRNRPRVSSPSGIRCCPTEHWS
jgi:hypothetical protein